MTIGAEIFPVISATVGYNLNLQLFSMLMQLNILYKLHITINLNSAFPNTLVKEYETFTEADYKQACMSSP